MSLPKSVSAEDRMDIIELYARYAWALDLADADDILSCFAEDAWFDHLWQGRVQGHEAILASLQKMWYGRPAWWYGRQHVFNHFRFFPVTEDKIQVKCFNQILQFNTEYNNNFVFGLGTRDDQVVRTDKGWVFQTLFVNAWRGREDVPWKGEMRLPPPRPPRPPVPPELAAGDDEENT
jgi:hypothetical protein